MTPPPLCSRRRRTFGTARRASGTSSGSSETSRRVRGNVLKTPRFCPVESAGWRRIRSHILPSPFQEHTPKPDSEAWPAILEELGEGPNARCGVAADVYVCSTAQFTASSRLNFVVRGSRFSVWRTGSRRAWRSRRARYRSTCSRGCRACHCSRIYISGEAAPARSLAFVYTI